jgi:hypothetical protein
MLRRIALVAGLCAVAVVAPLAGTASASCTDDFQTNLLSSDEYYTLSDHWWGLHYVHVVGGNVVIESGYLASDATNVTVTLAGFAQDYANNAAPATLTFVDCVAG